METKQALIAISKIDKDFIENSLQYCLKNKLKPVFIHVHEDFIYYNIGGDVMAHPEIMESFKEETKNSFDKKFKDFNFIWSEFKGVVSSIDNEIKNNQYDLLILQYKKRDFLDRLFNRSYFLDIVSSIKIPILVLK